MLELKNKRLCIFGMPGEGKSNLLCHIAAQFGAHAFIYDTMHEFPTDARYHTYRPAGRYDVDELEKVLKLVIKAARKKDYRLVAIDECNRFAPSKPSPLPDTLAEINDCCRHPEYNGFTPVFVARRPVQLNQDLTELAHYLIIFNLKGKNDIDYLNNFSAGLGDAVFTLPPYHFIIANQRREWEIHKPVPKMELGTNKKRTKPLQPL